jgi:hypothetical protein
VKNESFKQLMMVALLFLTVGWAVFVVLFAHHTMLGKEDLDILSLTGASGVLGALISWTADIKQFFFRKDKGELSTSQEVKIKELENKLLELANERLNPTK